MSYNKFIAPILFFVVIMMWQSCKDDEISSPFDYSTIQTISYSQHVQPLFNRSCAVAGCHTSFAHSAGLSLGSWKNLIRGSSYGNVIIAGNPGKSLLVTLFDGTTLRRQHPATGVTGFSVSEIEFLKRWISEGVKNDDGEIPFQHSKNKIYVPNQADDNVAIIDIDSLVVTRYIPVGSVTSIEAPHFIVSDSHSWYVSLINAGEVWKFDAHTDTLLKRCAVHGSPALLALTPDGSKLYVSQFKSSGPNIISVVNTTSMTLYDTIKVGTMPHGIIMNTAGTKVIVANMMSDNLSVVDVATDSVIATVWLEANPDPVSPAKFAPMEVAISPDDSIVAVTCSKSDEVRMFSATTYQLLNTFHVGNQPWHLKFTPDGNYCFVTNREGHTVSMIHVHHNMIETTQPSMSHDFDNPHGCDLTSDGRYVFVSNENGTPSFVPRYVNQNVGNVCVIDATLNRVIKVLEVGKMPTGLCVSR